MKTFLIDDMAPEDIAMLQALYSRSSESVEIHFKKVQDGGSSKFMDRYVANYGHKSIADCGSLTMFIEGVSLLAAKAVQDNPLYSGQETSTRYIDMSKQPIIDPFGTPKSKRVLERWMEFYKSSQARVEEIVRQRHPRRDVDEEKTYYGAVKARVFDIMRGFLPAGITTQLSWHTNLRQAADNLTRLRHHPSPELMHLAQTLTESLTQRYPSSGFDMHNASVSGVSNTDAQQRALRDAWEAQVWATQTYSDHSNNFFGDRHQYGDSPPWVEVTSGMLGKIRQYGQLLDARPRGCRLPHFMTKFGTVDTTFTLDFGSFRDLQRHRNGVCTMPLLNTSRGFESWYLEQLDDDLRKQAEALIEEQDREIRHLGDGSDRDAVCQQYYVALGFRVPCSLSYGLPAMLYLVEMRSSKSVHPTLRRRILAVATAMEEKLPALKMWVDKDADDWTVRRGSQTITAR